MVLFGLSVTLETAKTCPLKSMSAAVTIGLETNGQIALGLGFGLPETGIMQDLTSLSLTDTQSGRN